MLRIGWACGAGGAGLGKGPGWIVAKLGHNRLMPAIAVIDDEANIRETVAFALRREGYDV